MLTGDNGIIKQAGIAKEKTDKFRIIEQIRTEILSKQRKGLDDITEEEFKEILLKYGTLSENGVFSDCIGFTGDLIIPQSITTIEPAAFKNCSGFTSITIKKYSSKCHCR